MRKTKLLVSILSLVLILSIFAGCRSSGVDATQATETSTEPSSEPCNPNALYEDTFSEELKTEIKQKIVLKYDTVISWRIYDLDYEFPAYDYPYYGTINDCVIFRQSHAGMMDAPKRTLLEVADYTFEWNEDFNFYVYRDGEAFNLKEAYENGLLNKEQVRVIHEKHSGYYAQWLKDNPQFDNTFDVKAYIAGYKNTIYQSLYRLNGEKYGRMIASSDSKDDAVRVCTRHFTDNRPEPPCKANTVVECKVIYESDILYGIYVKWEVDGYYYEENVISFKKSVADITVNNVIYGDVASYRVCTNQKNQIEQTVLYLHYNESPFNGILYYETSSNENEYVFTIHSYRVIGGDWGIPNQYDFAQQKVTVDKTNGVITFQEPEILRSVYDYYQ